MWIYTSENWPFDIWWIGKMFGMEKRHLIEGCHYPSTFLSNALPDSMIKKWVLYDNRLWNIVVSMSMIEVLYKNGRHAFSEGLIEALIVDFVDKKKFIPNYKEKYVLSKRTNPSFSISFPDTLKMFLDVVYPVGLKPFLAFGTLLGYEREGEFLPWDLDIDLGLVDGDSDFDSLIESIEKSAFKILECSVDKFPYKIKCGLPGAPVVELVIFKKEEDWFVTYIDILGFPIKRKRSQFTLKKSKWIGIDVYVPDQPTIFLEENYGDWQNPRAIHHHLFDSQLTEFDSPLVRFYAKKYFFEILSNGNQEKVRYYLSSFEKKFPTERLWKSIGDKLVTQLT